MYFSSQIITFPKHNETLTNSNVHDSTFFLQSLNFSRNLGIVHLIYNYNTILYISTHHIISITVYTMSINIIIIEIYFMFFSIHFTIDKPVLVIHSLFAVVLHGCQCFDTKSSIFKGVILSL